MPSGCEMTERESQAQGLLEEDEKGDMLVVKNSSPNPKNAFSLDSYGDETASSESLLQ